MLKDFKRFLLFGMEKNKLCRSNYIIKALFLSFVFFTAPFTARAQKNLVTPSENILQMKYLKPYKISFNVILENSGIKRNLGHLTDEVKIIEINREKYFERIQKMPKINLVDTSINRINNLSPVLHSGHNPVGFMRLNFGKLKVTGEKYFSKNDSTVIINTNMPTTYYDSNMFEVVLSLLPLKENLDVKIPYYEFESGGYVLYRARVTGDEKIKTSENTWKNAWLLETTNGKSTTRFYITKDTRSVIRKVSIRSPQVKIIMDKI